jgi:hypothetical protein
MRKRSLKTLATLVAGLVAGFLLLALLVIRVVERTSYHEWAWANSQEGYISQEVKFK